MTDRRVVVLYVPSLDRRRIDPATSPFLADLLARRPAVELATHPSVELLPTIVTGVWPHEHRVWQVRLRPAHPLTFVRRVADLLPDRWMTTLQCIRHAFDPSYDLPTIEPRRRRRFEMHRMKMQRRSGGGLDAFDYGGRPTIFSAAGGDARHRTVFSFDTTAGGLAARIDGAVRIDLLEFYALDLFSHWNLDRAEAVRAAYRRTDALLREACAEAARCGLRTVLLVDHGQEPVRRVIDLRAMLAATGLRPDEYTSYLEVTNARFWCHTPRARATLERELGALAGATLLNNAAMARHHVAFRDEDGFGDLYCITDPGVAFFPHDFHHPWVNAYMASKTSEQAPRRISPIHRGTHGHLPGAPPDIGWLLPVDTDIEAVAERGELIDVAPTVLALAGLQAPAAMRGAVLLRPVGDGFPTGCG